MKKNIAFEVEIKQKYICEIEYNKSDNYAIVILKNNNGFILLRAIYYVKRERFDIIDKNIKPVNFKIGLRYLKNKIINILKQNLEF